MKGFIVNHTYTEIDNQCFVQIFGRLENNESFVVMNKFNPYFFVFKNDKEKVEELAKNFSAKVETSKLKSFDGEEILRITLSSQAELNKLRHEIHTEELNTFEGDIKPANRLLMDKDIFVTLDIDGDYEAGERVDRIYREADITPIEYEAKLKIASIDIEMNKAGELICIGITGKDYKKCFLVSDQALPNTINCKDVEDCLEKFKEELLEFDPDIITGWNVIDFDFVVLKELFTKHKIKFDLGRNNDQSKLRIESDFFKSSKLVVSGRIVIDGLNFIRDPYIKEAPTIKSYKFENYTLENVSQQILGKGKLLKGDSRHLEIDELYKNDQKKLVDYNLLDCELVYDIIEKSKFIELAIERAELTGLTIDRMNSSIASFDSVYVRKARQRGFVSPTLRYSENTERISGGYVKEPTAGIYDNVMVFDFKSIYPSMIRTFNIDPLSYLKVKEEGCIQSPNGACFKNSEGILPEIIEKLHKAREKAKKEKRELSNYAIKIIMNSFFGVMASPNCRYYNLDMGNAITTFGQEFIKLTAKKTEDKGYKVLYGDTDSIFVLSGEDTEKSNKLGKEIEKEMNDFYAKYIPEKYNRKSYLELEYEKLYISLLFPPARDGKGGAKKRYAGLKLVNNKEELEIVGLEAIRGDWTDAAQHFQRELLDNLFHKKDSKTFIKEYVKQIRDGKLNKELVYRKQLRKKAEDYTKTTPPHVKAVRKLPSFEGNLVEYYMTTDGPECVTSLKHALDYEHYITKQIKPIADSILVLLGLQFDNVAYKERQATLF